MPSPSDTVVEIPPPEAAPAEGRSLGLVVMLGALVVGLGFLITVTAPEIAPLEWTSQRGPEGSVNLDSLVPAAEGFALLSGMTVDGVQLWSSPDGVDWTSQTLQGAPSQLASVGEGLIAYGVRSGRFVERQAGDWVESAEEIAFPDEVRSRQGSGRPSVIDADPGFVAMSLFGDVWWSGDGEEFEMVVADPDWGPGSEVELAFASACRPPVRTSPDVPPMVDTDSGLVAMVSSNPAEPFGIWPVCEPEIWLSDQGQSWQDSDATLGDGAYVYNLAWRDQRYVAVGGFGIGQPAVWTSTDAEGWAVIDSFSSMDGIDLYTVEAGPAGWVILGRDSAGGGTVGWTSIDGLCWLSLPWFINGADVAVSTGHVIILDRTAYPDVWVGDVTGGRGSC